MPKITIPPAALDAGAQVVRKKRGDRPSYEIARAAFEAMVEAWPGIKQEPTDWERWKLDFAFLILPLMENPDDKA